MIPLKNNFIQKHETILGSHYRRENNSLKKSQKFASLSRFKVLEGEGDIASSCVSLGVTYENHDDK